MIHRQYRIVVSTLMMITIQRVIALGLILLMAVGCEASSPPPASGEISRGGVRIPLATGEAPAQLYQDSYALVIGASAYRSGWPLLPGTLTDMEAVSRILQQQGFKVTQVADPDHAQLRKAFDDFIVEHGQEPQNRLLFYFAGHGDTRKLSYGQEMGYLVPVDAPLYEQDAKGFLQKALDMQQIEVYARRIQAKHALFMFDSCFSGSLFSLSRAAPSEISRKTAQPVRQFITSGGAEEVVSDRSVFRDQFLAALQGEADYNHDGYVTGSELGSFLQDKVANYSRNGQHPQYGKLRDPMLDKGDLVFVVIGAEGKTQVQVTTGAGGGGVGIDAEVELEFWKSIKDSRNPKLFKEYRNRWPNGKFVMIAQAREAELETPPVKPPEPPVRVEPPPVPPVVATPAPVQQPRPAITGPAMVAITGGRFQMGSPQKEVGRDADEKQHWVTVNDFEIGQYEVTVGEFKRFVAASGYKTDADKTGEGCYVWSDSTWQHKAGFNWKNPNFTQGDDHPVVCVSWNDAVAYAEWLSKQTGQEYRLPTEAEWEYAARAGKETAYWWGKQASHDYANYGKDECCAGLAKGRDRWEYTAPVGSFDPNAWKLYDTAGNVWEWTCSVYDENYKGNENGCTKNNTSGPLAVRGGGWSGRPVWVRSAFRGRGDPPGRGSVQGFRLARSL